MSRTIVAETEIKNIVLLEEVVNNLNLSYTKNDNLISIQQGKRNIGFNCFSGQITYDSFEIDIVNKIKQQYAVSSLKKQAIFEGMIVEEEILANGEVILHVGK